MVNPRCRDAVPLFRDHFVRPIEGSAGSPMFSVCQTCPDVLRSRFRGFCTVFGFSLFGRVGVYSGISQWYRVGDAGALRAEPLQWVAGIKKTGFRGTPPFLSLSTALIHPTPWFLSSGRGTQSSQSAGPKDF